MKLGEYLCKSFTFMISLLAHDHGYVPVIQYVIFTSLTTVYYENSACTHYSKTSLGESLLSTPLFVCVTGRLPF